MAEKYKGRAPRKVYDALLKMEIMHLWFPMADGGTNFSYQRFRAMVRLVEAEYSI